jgi:uncharacterized protein YbdZ (MbtH family)
MLTIWKFPFDVTDRFTLEIPDGYRILHVEMQGKSPCLWAIVDEARPPSQTRFALFGTGFEVPAGWEHVGTFQQPPYVWHLFREEV